MIRKMDFEDAKANQRFETVMAQDAAEQKWAPLLRAYAWNQGCMDNIRPMAIRKGAEQALFYEARVKFLQSLLPLEVMLGSEAAK